MESEGVHSGSVFKFSAGPYFDFVDNQTRPISRPWITLPIMNEWVIKGPYPSALSLKSFKV